jgi:hypothetical protein
MMVLWLSLVLIARVLGGAIGDSSARAVKTQVFAADGSPVNIFSLEECSRPEVILWGFALNRAKPIKFILSP